MTGNGEWEIWPLGVGDLSSDLRLRLRYLVLAGTASAFVQLCNKYKTKYPLAHPPLNRLSISLTFYYKYNFLRVKG